LALPHPTGLFFKFQIFPGKAVLSFCQYPLWGQFVNEQLKKANKIRAHGWKQLTKMLLHEHDQQSHLTIKFIPPANLYIACCGYK